MKWHQRKGEDAAETEQRVVENQKKVKDSQDREMPRVFERRLWRDLDNCRKGRQMKVKAKEKGREKIER